MKRIFLLGFLCFGVYSMFAQQSTSYTGAVMGVVEVVEIIERDAIITTNIPTERTLDNQLVGTTDNGSYTLRCGEHYLVLKANGYYTKKAKFAILPNAENKFYYKMIKKPTLPTQWQQFVMVDYTWGDSYVSYDYSNKRGISSIGFRYGWQKIVGWYVAGNISVQGAHYVQNSTGKPLSADKISRNKLSIMGGANCWLGCPLYFYTGLGYGYQSVLIRDSGRKWYPASIYGFPYSGVAWECGLQANYKGITARIGYALVGNREDVFSEVSVGMGYTFNK